MKSISVLVAALSLAGSAAAFWRMPCRSRSGLGRMDPIVDPGVISAHVHAIHGSGNFGFEADYDSLNSSSCTSCGVYQDKSAYWTPALYFMFDNGTTVLVDQVGGMLAYYLFYLDDIKVFPEGFRMVAGDPNVRNFTGPVPDDPLSSWPTDPSDQFFLQQRSIGFNCLNYATAPEPSLYRHTMPDKSYLDANCADGIRLELAFPSCWNGENDSDDHRSHVAWPSLVKEGNCPDSHPQHLPFMFFETIWNTNAFNGQSGTFMLSNGDPVGTGYHGDFIMGWESEQFLEDAMNTCTNESGEIGDCPIFDLQDDDSAAQCTFSAPSVLLDDECHGPREGLPVNIPIQWGPTYATAYDVVGRDGVTASSLPDATVAPSTYSHASFPTYSPADPASTATAQLGIIVAQVSVPVNSAAVNSAPAESTPTPTSPPAVDNAAGDSQPIATSYITQGNEVIEMVIDQVQVTITATATETATALRKHRKHKRHMDKHLRRSHH